MPPKLLPITAEHYVTLTKNEVRTCIPMKISRYRRVFVGIHILFPKKQKQTRQRYFSLTSRPLKCRIWRAERKKMENFPFYFIPL